MVGLASMKCAHRLLSSSPLIRMELGSPRSVTASLVSNANDCVCFPFMLVPTSSWPDCLPPPKPQTRWHWSLPSPGPASFSDLESSCLPGVERRCHSDFLLFICCMGRPDHSLFLQQIPQQLLQVCGGTSSPRGVW